MDYEAIIIGCGPAGLSAAIYLGRAEIKTLLIGKKQNSQLIKAHNIENYFGFPQGIPGKDLLELGIKQAKRFKVKILNKEVVKAEQIKDGYKIKLEDKTSFTTKVIVIATGTPLRLSGIENEETFIGKGIHYCVECDAPFFKGKKVAIIGNGNHAAEGALDLNIFTKDVSIISNGEKFSFSKEMKKAITQRKIKLVDKKVDAFLGKETCDSIQCGTEKIKFDGIFMACGTASALDFALGLGLQIDNNILTVDENNQTNLEGIFAAGNCTSKCRQVAKNVGDGCNAATEAIKYIRNKKLYVDYC